MTSPREKQPGEVWETENEIQGTIDDCGIGGFGCFHGDAGQRAMA
jgi:hypothetical protein